MACEGCEDYAIVARIWKQLGSPSYAQLAGRSIYDLIAEKDAEIARLREGRQMLLGEISDLRQQAAKRESNERW